MYKALISFSGVISMAEGDVREIPDITIANDLLRAGYIAKVENDKPKKPKEAKKK